MGDGSRRHAELAEELGEWLEDLWVHRIDSRAVLAAVPPGWGRTTVLDRLAAAAEADEGPVTLTARIGGRDLPAGAGVQAAVLRDCLAGIAERHRAAELLGLDRLGGAAQLGLGVGGLFVSGPAAAVAFLVAGLGIGAAGKMWDDSPAGQDGALARAARAVAATSAQVPVLVVVDDADCLDERVALTLIENLIARHDGRVLVVTAVNPGGSLQRALVSRARQGITEGRVRVADTDPDMGYAARADLAGELCPRLPRAAARRIAAVTATFADVFAVAAAPRLAEAPAPGSGETELLAVVGAVAAARLRRPAPSPEAVAVAWAGGLLHRRQAAGALGAVGWPRAADGDPDLLRSGDLERVTDPAGPRLAGEVTALSRSDKAAMAALLADEALRVAADPGEGLVERMAAGQAAHHVRGDLTDRMKMPAIQRQLAAALEEFGETAAALDVAAAALREYPAAADSGDRDWLQAAVLRLTRRAPGPVPPEAAALIAEAAARGAGLGLEARVWAAAALLREPGQRETALALTDQVTAALDEHAAALGPGADQWRLLLAFEAGRAGHPAITERLLAPLAASGDDQREQAAQAVLRAGAGPGADIRLQNIILETELTTLPPDAGDDRLRIHHALAMNHNALGEYPQALLHAQHELALRTAIQTPDHPDTLATRHTIAFWAGHSGDLAEALRLFRELLPDRQRVLGPHHPETLSTQGNIAYWVGRFGDMAEALRLFRELLPDQQRVLGPHHPETLTTRSNLASCVGRFGDPAEALRLFRELLPDQQRVLGPDHPDTLTTRDNIASWAGRCGDPAEALRLFRELLPDLERVLGPHHPDTLTTRDNIALWVGWSGDLPGGLRLLRELLPDLERILGPDHPDTLTTRNNIANWAAMTGQGGQDRLCLRAAASGLRTGSRPAPNLIRHAVRGRLAWYL